MAFRARCCCSFCCSAALCIRRVINVATPAAIPINATTTMSHTIFERLRFPSLNCCVSSFFFANAGSAERHAIKVKHRTYETLQDE